MKKFKGQEVHIYLRWWYPYFSWPCKLNDMEQTLVKVQTKEFLKAKFMELPKEQYVSITLMFAKKDIFCNWIEHWMCGDYGLVKKQNLTKMPCHCPRRFFYSIGQAKVFNALNLYGLNIIGIAFPRRWPSEDYILGIDLNGKDCLYQCKFLPFGLKNALVEFQRMMDQFLVGLEFAKCDMTLLCLVPPWSNIVRCVWTF